MTIGPGSDEGSQILYKNFDVLRPRIKDHNAIPWLSNWFHAGLLSSPLARPQNPRHPPQNPDQTSKSQQTMKSWQDTILDTPLKHKNKKKKLKSMRQEEAQK